MELSDHLTELGEFIEFNKGENIFTQGETSNHLYLVNKGFLKAYYTTPSGKEYVKSFISENNFIGISNTNYAKEGYCGYSLVCLEPSVLLRLRFPDLLDRIKREPDLTISVMNILIDVIIKKERREYEFLCLSAEQRYQQIKQHSPDILNRATQNDIARYLGITPVALSRIKHRTQC